MNTNIDSVATPVYRDLLKLYHSQTSWGASGASHALVIEAFAKELKAKTILDYGCGRGTLKKCASMQMFNVREYDPGISGKDLMPSPADLVVATDVLEHIEPECLDNVLEHLKALAVKGIFLNIALNKAKAVLPDGRNAHLLIRTAEWWLAQLDMHAIPLTKVERRKGLYVWSKVALSSGINTNCAAA